MRLFTFTLTNPDGSTSVWQSDGTDAGTSLVSTTSTTPPPKPGDFVFWQDDLLFNSGSGLFVTNGAGSVIQLGGGDPTSYIAFGDKVILASSNPNSNSLLYQSPGTYYGTQAVLFPDGLTNITGPFVSLGNRIAFTGTDGSGAFALFVTDGTGAGSAELSRPYDIGNTSQAYAPAPGSSVVTGSGNDTISASGAASIIGGSGSVTIYGGSEGGIYTGGAKGDNVLVSFGASGYNTTLAGAASGDRLFGSAAGNDTLTIGRGRESAVGGGGNTTIDGGQAASVIFTGSGQTTVTGGLGGGDTIVGSRGALNVTAVHGDAIFGGAGALAVTGSTLGADSIVGGAGALSVVGQGGNMLVVAGQSETSVSTGTGASLVFAGSGATTVSGGTGSMQVVLGAGAGTFNEGTGQAVYDVISGEAGGTDILTNFKVGTDTIDLFGYGSAAPTITSSSGSSIVNLSDGTRITIVGVTDPGSSIIG